MAVWLIRAGAHGEHEDKFIADSRVYVTWDGMNLDLRTLADRDALIAALAKRYPEEATARKLGNWAGQIWPFAQVIQKGDMVIVPLKGRRAIQVGEVVGDYQFQPSPEPYFHWRAVKWVGEALPRALFPADLLLSFNSLLTICRIQRNDAETRLKAMLASGWKVEETAGAPTPAIDGVTQNEESADTDIEESGRDQIARLIEARFKGHNLTRLVNAILKAQGYTTYQSPPGPDGGADILAGSGPLGFSSPRICVEVKSGASPIDRPTVDKLLGAVTKFGADEGLFVSWSGYKSNVRRELAASFFRVRLWSQEDLLSALFETYERLDDEIKAELPLKRVWTVATKDGE